MQRGDFQPVEELFRWACPKFVVPTPHSYEDRKNQNEVSSFFMYFA